MSIGIIICRAPFTLSFFYFLNIWRCDSNQTKNNVGLIVSIIKYNFLMVYAEIGDLSFQISFNRSIFSCDSSNNANPLMRSDPLASVTITSKSNPNVSTRI